MLRLLSIPIVVVVMVVGIWVAGGLITDDFVVAMGLTVGWMVVLGAICLAIAIRRRRLALPILATYVVAAAAIGTYLGLTTLADKVVHERVAIAEPPARHPSHADRHAPRNVLLAHGTFLSGAHASGGTASEIDLAQGGRVLTLTEFATAPGPDLRVYLVAGPAADESEVDDFVDLGGLKGNKGDQQYGIPAGTDLARYRTVVIWCRAFTVLFARAPLERS